MKVIGSFALGVHLSPPDGDFIPTDVRDIDVLCSPEEWDNITNFNHVSKHSKFMKVDNVIYEFIRASGPTEEIVLNSKSAFKYVTQVGALDIVSSDLLFKIYTASAIAFGETTAKGKKYLENARKLRSQQEYLQAMRTPFVIDRVEEIKARIKSDFFHKHKGLSEIIEHDELHEIVSRETIMGPTYKKFVDDIVEVSFEKWKELSIQDKFNRCVEETLVIYFERSFTVTCMKQKKIVPFSSKMINKAVDHVNKIGLKDQPEYITDFGRRNLEEIRGAVHWELSRDWQELKQIMQDILDGKKQVHRSK